MDRIDPKVSLSFCQTPIYSAIWRHRSRDQLQRALRSFPEFIHLRQPGTLYTYLHLVVAIGNESCEVSLVPMVYLLSKAGVQIDATDCKNRTALELALVKQLSALVVALLRVGTDQTAVDYPAIINGLQDPGRDRLMGVFRRYTPDLWTAATNNDLGTVYVLVNSWCRVKVRRQIEGQNLTLIEYLRMTGHRDEMVDLLTGYEMTLEFVHSTLAGDEEAMLDILMDESDCDVDIMDISFVDQRIGILRPRSLRDTAISLKHPGRILQLLGPNYKKHSTSIRNPDIFTIAVESSKDAITVDRKDTVSWGSYDDGDYDLLSPLELNKSSSIERNKQRSSVEDKVSCHSPLLSLSSIRPRITYDDVTDKPNDLTCEIPSGSTNESGLTKRLEENRNGKEKPKDAEVFGPETKCSEGRNCRNILVTTRELCSDDDQVTVKTEEDEAFEEEPQPIRQKVRSKIHSDSRCIGPGTGDDKEWPPGGTKSEAEDTEWQRKRSSRKGGKKKINSSFCLIS